MFTERLINALCMMSVNLISLEGGSQQAQNKYWQRQGNAALTTCKMVARRANIHSLDPVQVIALSYIETRHRNDLTSPAGAKGALQALPKYWSRPHDPDYITAGLRAWRYYSKKYPDPQTAVGRYNGGGRETQYAKGFIEHYQELKSLENLLRWPK